MSLTISNFITGQGALERLLSEVEGGSVGHAYILSGPRGVGKRSAAEIFARALHCTGGNKPCGVCHACLMHEADTHPDVLRLVPEDNGNLKIASIRAAENELFMKPKIAERKILIIEGADGMTEGAQNALLKSFEEPPSYGVVVLLAENLQNILPTIRSRGVKLALEPFPIEKIRTFVAAEYPAMAAKSAFVARYSGGIVGRAKEICEDADFFALRTELFNALCGLTGGKECIFPIAEIFGFKKKPDAAHRAVCFDLMLSWLGDVLEQKQGREGVNEDYAEKIAAFGSRASSASVIRAVETVSRTMAELNPSMKYDLWIVNMLINCWGDLHGNGNRS